MNANAEHKIDDEDILRAELYSFLAALLRVEPQDNLLASVSQISGDDTPIGKATGTLSYLAKEMDAATIRSEYVDLFIGVGRGELLPYCSYYLTGFLNEKPLANLRQDMASIGIARAENVKDPEDHIASLFDMMAGLIKGTYGRAYSVAEQKSFFEKHIAPWAHLLMRDIEEAQHAVFYAPVGTMGRLFLEIESQAFEMDLTMRQ